jgi:hypothetical protein
LGYFILVGRFGANLNAGLADYFFWYVVLALGAILHQAVHRAKVERSEKVRALKRLAQLEQTGPIQA